METNALLEKTNSAKPPKQSSLKMLFSLYFAFFLSVGFSYFAEIDLFLIPARREEAFEASLIKEIREQEERIAKQQIVRYYEEEAKRKTQKQATPSKWSPFPEKDIPKEKRTLPEIPALELVSLFHRPQQAELAAEVECLKRELKATYIFIALKKTKVPVPRKKKKPAKTEVLEPVEPSKLVEELEWNASSINAKFRLLQNIKKKLFENKLRYVPNDFSYQEIVSEITFRPPIDDPQTPAEEIFALIQKIEK